MVIPKKTMWELISRDLWSYDDDDDDDNLWIEGNYLGYYIGYRLIGFWA